MTRATVPVTIAAKAPLAFARGQWTPKNRGTTQPANTMSNATTSSTPGSGRTKASQPASAAVGRANARERNSKVLSVNRREDQR
jgi:hypothetical protein